MHNPHICPTVANKIKYYNRYPIKIQQAIKEEEQQQMGTGICIFDHLFQTINKKHSKSNTVIELSGSYGKSSLAISFAISYLLSTSEVIKNSKPPQVIIFDCDNGLHIPNIILMLRTAILRKEGQRQHYHQNIQEQTQKINNEIISCLQRIHICSPKDYSIGLLSSLEILIHSCSEHNYPVLLIINSLSSFDNRTKMLEEIQKGVSGKMIFIVIYRILLPSIRI